MFGLTADKIKSSSSCKQKTLAFVYFYICENFQKCTCWTCKQTRTKHFYYVHKPKFTGEDVLGLERHGKVAQL